MSSSDQTEPTPAEEPVETVPEAEAEKRKRAGLLRLKAAVILPLLFAGAALVYFLMIDGIIADQLVAQARAHAGQNADAQVGNVRFSIFGPDLKVEDYQIWQTLPDGTRHEVLFLREANLDIEFWPLLERRLVVNDVSATEIRVQEPWSPPEEDQPGESDVPTDTNQPKLNDYLKQIKDILNSEELKDLQDWIEKLQEYTKEKQEPIPEEAPETTEETEPVLGPAERAWYVREALAREEATPRVVVKNASLAELAFAWADETGATFAHRVTDLQLSAQSVSSDPIAYKLPMEFIAVSMNYQLPTNWTRCARGSQMTS